MNTEQKLEQILALLNHFIEKQEAFNARQEAFNAKQEAFNMRQEGTNARFEVSLDSIRRDLSEFRHEEELQHNMTHRLISQAFEHINELKSDPKKPWEK